MIFDDFSRVELVAHDEVEHRHPGGFGMGTSELKGDGRHRVDRRERPSIYRERHSGTST